MKMPVQSSPSAASHLIEAAISPDSIELPHGDRESISAALAALLVVHALGGSPRVAAKRLTIGADQFADTTLDPPSQKDRT